MTGISVLDPLVFRGVVEKFTAPESLELLSTIPNIPNPFPTVHWDIIRGARAIARPNVPNAEAHIVPQLPRGSGDASLVYLREKKVFNPTTLHWIRQATVTPNPYNATQAEDAVLREVNDLNARFDNYAEWLLWQALQGSITIDSPSVQAVVDYQFLSTHKPSPATTWASATAASIVGDIRAWKRLVRRDGGVDADTAYATEATIARIYTAFLGATGDVGGLLSDRMKDQYYTTGVLPGFMGLDWKIQEAGYNATDASAYSPADNSNVSTLFLADDALILGNFKTNRPVELAVGPSADDSAPHGYTGKFGKTWKEEDPSARQYLLEWNILPVVTRPEQIVAVADVTS